MKITLLYDNESCREDLKGDWGFACLVEMVDRPVILFDTGANGKILLENMNALGLSPEIVDEVILSHAHWDHTDGLPAFIEQNSDITLYAPPDYTPPQGLKKVYHLKDPCPIHEDIFLTGWLNNQEQSLAIKTEKGVVVIVGCSHPGVGKILEAGARFGEIYGIIGGLHGFKEFEQLQNLELICACHCTRYREKIRKKFPDKWAEGGAGREITI